MANHPEIPGNINDLTDFINNSSIALVMCHGCQQQRPVNSAYAGYLVNGIRECRFCKDGGYK